MENTPSYIAITREVSPAIAECELTYLERQPIDATLANRQHQRYSERLQEVGCQVIALPDEPTLPDSVFVEDAALVFDELALLTRPGAESRRPEVESIAAALAPFRSLLRITAPGSVDGGDVLRLGKHVFVGLTTRSNRAAIEQMRAILAPHGYTVTGVSPTGCLHLKSAVTQVTANTLLLNPDWVNSETFPGWEILNVDPAEPHAANAVLVGETIIFPTSYPRTQKILEQKGIRVLSVDVSELIKAEGAVTCCSLIFKILP